MLDQRFHEEIDACRPGSRDLDEPEMSRLAEALAHDPIVRSRYEAVQRLDARLVDAFAAVPVPAGLAARLLAGLQLHAPEAVGADSGDLAACPQPHAGAQPNVGVQPTPAFSVGSSSAAASTLPLTPARRPLPRRCLLVALAASLLVATGLWTLFRSSSAPASGELTSDAAEWFEHLPDHWQPIAEAPANLPLPSAIVGNSRGWQTVSKAVAKRGVVYSLRQGAKSRAVLFVLSAKRPGLPSTIPLTPQSATGGLSISAWQSQGLVYVLIVEGDERAYRRFLPPGRPPLA